MKRPTVLIRVDASQAIGSGHVMRCLSLAAALAERGARLRFACRELPGNLGRLIESQGYAVDRLPAPAGRFEPRADIAHASWLGVDSAQEIDEMQALLGRIGGVDLLLVDHYGLDAAWQAAMRAHARRIAVIDDLADRAHDADVLLDPLPDEAAEARYRGLLPPSCARLLGPAYALLRPEFAQARSLRPPQRGDLERVFVFLGGVDAADVTSRALDALVVFDVEAEVVVGAGNVRADAIAARCAREPRWHFSQAVDDIATRMAQADVAIGAGGTTSWERACIGLPSLIVVAADNQRPTAAALERAGCARVLELDAATPQAIAAILRTLDAGTLRALSEAGRTRVDGRGAMRVARCLLPPPVSLRTAQAEDCDDLYAWRNEPSVCEQSHDADPIPYDAHCHWFEHGLNDPDRLLLIAEHRGEPVGVLRYQIEDAVAVVSIYLVPGASGQGFGGEILRRGHDWLRRWRPGQSLRLRAEILPGNLASRRAFAEAGFGLEEAFGGRCVYGRELVS